MASIGFWIPGHVVQHIVLHRAQFNWFWTEPFSPELNPSSTTVFLGSNYFNVPNTGPVPMHFYPETRQSASNVIYFSKSIAHVSGITLEGRHNALNWTDQTAHSCEPDQCEWASEGGSEEDEKKKEADNSQSGPWQCRWREPGKESDINNWTRCRMTAHAQMTGTRVSHIMLEFFGFNAFSMSRKNHV